MLWLRKIVFYIFSLVYLILCPLIVARMLGFVFDPLTHRLEKTGLVYVSTIPPQANVYIDGRLCHQKTPTAVRDLTPGKHFIRIEMDGYNDWEDSVRIKGKRATVLANILLIPQQWPIQRLSNQTYQNITFADDDVLLATNPLLKNIDLFRTTINMPFEDPKTLGEKLSLFPPNSIYADGHLLRLFQEPQSPFMVLEILIKQQHKFLWLNIKESPPLIEEISDLFGGSPLRIAWDNADHDNVYAFYPSHIDRINIKNKTINAQTTTLLPASLQARQVQALQGGFMINAKADLLTRERGWIRIYPQENLGNVQEIEIAQSKSSTNMYFEEKNGELYYLDPEGYLNVVDILPNHPILNIPLPDALRKG